MLWNANGTYIYTYPLKILTLVLDFIKLAGMKNNLCSSPVNHNTIKAGGITHGAFIN